MSSYTRNERPMKRDEEPSEESERSMEMRYTIASWTMERQQYRICYSKKNTLRWRIRFMGRINHGNKRRR
jgi:hypothetical protein